MFKWEKQGKLFDPRDLKQDHWMHEFAQSPCALVMPDRVRVFFCSRPKPQKQSVYTSYLAYIDLDRSNLKNVIGVCKEPLMKLGNRGTFDEFGTNPVSVILHHDEVRVYFAGWTRCESVPINGAIGVAVSSDGGETFARLGEGPVISYSASEPFMMGSPRVRKFNGRWYLWYVSGRVWLKTEGKPEPVYKIRMASSEDGINWSKQNQDLLEDRLGEHECQACADVIYRDGSYHMFYSFRNSHNYQTAEGGYRIGYAVSKDLLHWKREDQKAGISVSQAGWDSEMVSYPNVFVLGDDTYMLYQGNGMGRAGFGLAKLISPENWSWI